MVFGRRKIYTDKDEITRKNVIKVLQNAMIIHDMNRQEIDNLIRFEKGDQPLQRTKTYRPEIDCHCIDNVANMAVEFKRGFHWGNPITFIQSKEIDKDKVDLIDKLNEQYALANTHSVSQELGYYVETCGIGYEYIDINKRYRNGKSLFSLKVLDPRDSFIVYSSDIGNYPMMGVTYRTDSKGTRYYTCITDDFRFEIVDGVKIVNGEPTTEREWHHASRSGERNPFGVINIVSCERDMDRMGCFERQIPLLNSLNIMESDFINDVDQNTQAVWLAVDIEVEEDESGNPGKVENGDWLYAETTADGRKPTVDPLVINYDYSGILNNIEATRNKALVNMNIPQRNDNSGGSTGIAMDSATGWNSAEMAASKQQPFIEKWKMDEVDVVLCVINTIANVGIETFGNLSLSDVKPNIKRQKNFELTTKMNFIATGLSHGFALEDLLPEANMVSDPNKVIERSGDGVRKYQEANVFNMGNSYDTEQAPNSDRMEQDSSDQIENSPLIDSNRTS